MTFDQRRLILNSFIISHFSYCPIVWMFHSRMLSGRINDIHERDPRIVYKDFNSPFQELLIEDNSLKIHHRNQQKRVTEIFEVTNGLSPELMNDVFEFIEKPCFPPLDPACSPLFKSFLSPARFSVPPSFKVYQTVPPPSRNPLQP